MGLTMALSALLISAGAGVWQGAPAAYQQLHAVTGAPHVWFLLPSHPARESAARAIGADPAVAAVTLRVPVFTMAMRVEDQGSTRSVDVRVYGMEPAGGSPPASPAGFALTAGRWPEPGAAEAVIDRHLARVLDLTVGAEVELVGRDGPAAVRVVGIAASALHCPYPECVVAPVVVPTEVLARLVRQPHILLGVQLHEPETAAAFAFGVRRQTVTLGLFVDAGTWLDLVAYQRLSHSLTAGFFLLAGALALLAGSAVTSHVVAAAAIAGRRVMGLSRAVGYTPRQVAAAFALGCGAVGTAAAVLGAPVGWVLAGAWIDGAGVAGPPAGWMPWIIALAVAGAAALLGAWAARRTAWAGALAAVGAAGGGVPVRLRLGLPGLSQLFVIRPVRPAVPAVAAAISLVVAVGAVTLANTMASFGRDPAQVGIFHQLLVEPGGLPGTDVDALLRADPDICSFHREAWARVDVPDGATSIIVRALDGDWDSLPWRVLNGRFVGAPGEIALGTSAMERLDVRPGDTISVAVGPWQARWRVSGAYLDLTNAGLSGAVAWETLAELYSGVEPAAWLVRLAPGADQEAVRERLLKASGHALRVTRAGFEPPAAVRTAWRLVDGLALLLGGVAVIAVIQGMSATVREQRRDIAVLKAIGMTPAQLVAGTTAGIAGATAVGTAAGVALGLGLTWAGFRAAAVVSGIGGLAPVFPWGQIALLAAVAPGFAGLVAAPAALAAARAPAVELGGEQN